VNNKTVKAIRRKAGIIKMSNLDCGAFRCRICGTPNYDGGPVCGDCDENPYVETANPSITVTEVGNE